MQRGLPAGRPPEWFALERPEDDRGGGAALRRGRRRPRHHRHVRGDVVPPEAPRPRRRARARQPAGGRGGEAGGRRARALVSASVGPSGQLLEPYGDTSPDAVEAAFAEQIAALASAGADVLCIETMGDLTEATRAVKAAKAAAPGVPVMATMTFEPTPRGYFTVMGVSVEKAVRRPRGGGRRRGRLELRHRHRGHGRDRARDGPRHAPAAPHPAERRPAGEPRRPGRLRRDAGDHRRARAGAARPRRRDRRRLLRHDARPHRAIRRAVDAWTTRAQRGSS